MNAVQLLNSTKSPLVALTVLKKICDHPRLMTNRQCLELGLEMPHGSVSARAFCFGVIVNIIKDKRLTTSQNVGFQKVIPGHHHLNLHLLFSFWVGGVA